MSDTKTKPAAITLHPAVKAFHDKRAEDLQSRIADAITAFCVRVAPSSQRTPGDHQLSPTTERQRR